MGIRRGTVLGLTGIAGALLERQFGLVGAVLTDLVGLGPIPPVFGWILGCFVGVVAGDIVTAITGQDVALGRWAGIKKGFVASFVAGLGYVLSSTGLAGAFLAASLSSVPGFGPESVLTIGSIWLGAVLGDLFDA